MDEQGLADDVANDPRDDLDRMVRRTELKEPRGRTAWTGQLEVITGQPDHEHLGLDRTLDVEAVRNSSSRSRWYGVRGSLHDLREWRTIRWPSGSSG